MDPKLLLEWWNLIYIAPLALALLYLALYVLTGIGADGDGDAAVEADADADVDADVDADADIDADVDADADVVATGHEFDPGVQHHIEVHHDAHVPQQPGTGSLFMDVMVWLGAGQVPLSLILIIFMMIWGMAGFAANRMLWGGGFPGWLIPVLSIPLALACSFLFTRFLARTVGRFMPMNETSAKRKDALVGNVGETLSLIDSKFGLVQVRARSGDLFQVPCRVVADRPTIAKGERVLLVDYNKKEQLFYVVPDEVGNAAKKA